MRELPDGLKALLRRKGRVETHSTLTLITTDFYEAATTYHLGTAGITADGIYYEPYLKTVGVRRSSITRAVDRVEALIFNTDSRFGPHLINLPNRSHGAIAKVGRYWRDMDSGDSYHLVLMQGIVQTAKANENELRVGILSDIYAKSIGGGRRTARKCQWTFKDAETCGYSGTETTCNKLYDSSGGCSGRSNQHHYGGFIYIQSQSAVAGGSAKPVPPVNQLVKTTDGTTTTSFQQRTAMAFESTAFQAANDAGNDWTRIKPKEMPTGWINVKLDYSAVGDGSTNDTTAIQNAINAAQTAAHKTVYFPPGTYKVTGLTVAGEVRLVGANQKISVIYSTTNAIILDCTGASSRGCQIEHLRIRGDVAAGSSQIGIKVSDASYAFLYDLRNLHIEKCGSYGLYVGNAYSSNFKNIFIDDCAGYPLLYDAANMPGNLFELIYIGSLRATALSGFRIKAGDFIGKALNGINNTPTGAAWMTLGKKNGVDGDATNAGANADLTDCNIESFDTVGIKVYHASRLNLRGTTYFAGSGSNRRAVDWEHINDGTDYFAQYLNRGIADDSVVIADGRSGYQNSEPFRANGFLPIETQGAGPSVAGETNLSTYYNSTASASSKMSRSDGHFHIQTVTGATTIAQPGVKLIESNLSGAATITIPWAGWYRAADMLLVKDIAGNAATHNITLQVGGGGTIAGAASYVIDQDGGAVILTPDCNTGSGDWRIIAAYPATASGYIDGSGASPRLAYFSDADTLTSKSGLEWDNGNNALKVPGATWTNDGGASTPAYSFTNDTDTGMYRENTIPELRWTVGGSQRVGLSATDFQVLVNIIPTSAGTRDVGGSGSEFRDVWLNRRLYLRNAQSTGAAPTESAGTGAGTGPTLTVDGTDTCGTIILTTGSGPATSAKVFDITVSAAFTTQPVAVIYPANAAAAALSGAKQVFVDDAAITSSKWQVTSGSTALDATTEYKWVYHCIGF